MMTIDCLDHWPISAGTIDRASAQFMRSESVLYHSRAEALCKEHRFTSALAKRESIYRYELYH